MVASITNNVIDDSDITFEYDSLGRVTNRSIDGTNNSIDWVYDAMGRVTTETNALGQFNFAYPDNGSGTSKGITRLASITYPNDQVTNFSYYGNTGDHRLQTIENLDDSSNLISEFGYQYNPAGEITQWTQQRGTGQVKQWNIGYDLAGQLSSVQAVAGTPGPPHINEHFFYDYDLAGNRTSVQTNGTQTATIGGTVTASDVLTITVHDAGLSGGSKAKDYTVQGGDSLSDIAAGLKDAINADTDLQGIGVSATSSDEVISIASISSNPTSLSKSLSGGATETITLALKASVKQASHNNVNALTSISAGGATRFLATTNKAVKSATVDAQAATLNHAKQFTANPVLSSGTNSVSVAATDGGDNQETVGFDVPVDTASSQSLTYDSNGNMTSDGTNSFEWDCENRLIKIVYPGNNNFTELLYDGLGNLVKIVETESGSVTSTKQFVVSGDKKREERNASDVLNKKLFSLGQQDGSTNHFYALNHLGSVTDMTDESADVTSRYSYGAFGETIRTDSSVDADIQYAGYYSHARSGLGLTLHRSYNSRLGRWLNRDPIEEQTFGLLAEARGSVSTTGVDRRRQLMAGLISRSETALIALNNHSAANLYQYVSNDPVNSLDPLGTGDDDATFCEALCAAMVTGGLAACLVCGVPAWICLALTAAGALGCVSVCEVIFPGSSSGAAGDSDEPKKCCPKKE